MQFGIPILQNKVFLKTLLVMKLSIIIILSTCLQLSAKTSAQSITLSEKNAQLENVLKEIRKQSGYDFVYTFDVIQNAHPIDVDVKNADIKTVLDKCFRDQPLTYTIIEKVVVLRALPHPENLAVINQAEAASIDIHGKVTDVGGRPLAGVSIVEKGSSKGTSTNTKGEYNLNRIDENGVLIFSAVGYSSETVAVKGRSTINIVLKVELKQQDEVVVIGYGESKRANLTSAVSVIDGSDIVQTPVIKASDALMGRVPGLIAIKQTGGPGKSSSLLIRGVSTLGNAANNQPLTVIDGVPGRNIDDLDPNEIESISVLKDAAAVAVYGARGANGVLLVTTKKGTIGRAALTLTSNVSQQRPTRYIETLDSYNYALLYNEAQKNEGSFNPTAGRGYTDEQLQQIKDGSNPDVYANTDWYHQMLHPYSMQTQHNLSLSGGAQKSRYFVSAGYSYEGGLFDLVNYKRYNLRANYEMQPTKNITVSLIAGGNVTKSQDMAVFNASYAYQYAVESPRILPNQFSNGLYNYIPAARGNMYLMTRGDNGTSNTNGNEINTTLSVNYDMPFIKGLSGKVLFAYDNYNSSGKAFLTPYDAYTRDVNGNYAKANTYPAYAQLTQRLGGSNSTLVDVSLNYKRKFNKHDVSALILYDYNDFNNDAFTIVRGNYQSSALPFLGLGDPTTTTASETAGQGGRIGLVGRLNYIYDGKYIFEFNFRYDGSDKFPPADRFGFFPSISAGWRISDEKFFRENVTFINNLKLRGSYGLAGNDVAGLYNFLSTYSILSGSDSYSFGGTSPVYAPGLAENVLPNPHFTWEKARTVDIGLDAGFLGNKLTFEADYFNKYTYDILGTSIATSTSLVGVGLPSDNIYKARNKGFELQLNYQNKIGSVSYYIRPNFTYLKNDVLYYPQATSIPEWQRLQGKAVGFNAVTGYIAEGLYQSQDEIDKGPTPLYTNVAPGDIKYKDLDGDGKITPNDKTIINKGNYPGTIFGAALGAAVKGLELNLFFQGAGKVNTLFSGTLAFPFSNDGVASKQHLDRWTPDNPDASFPRLWISHQNNSQSSTYWLKNTSYLRLKNIELAYTLPKSVLKGIGISNVRVYLSGFNLLTFTNVKYIDPESTSTISYPLMKYYNAGINIQF